MLSQLLCLILLAPLFFVSYPLISKPGTILAGDFPHSETTSNAFETIRWTWIENGIFSSFEIIPRYPIIGLLHFFSFLNLSPDVVSKAMIISVFLLSSFSFYFSSILFFRNKLNTYDTKFKFAAIIGSLFYAYNVWSFHRMPQWYLWLAYAFLPLFFVSVILSLRSKKIEWKYILTAVATWTIASSAIQMIIIFGLIFLSLSILFILISSNKRQNLIHIIKPIILVLSLYLLINSYWIYPYALAVRDKVVAPSRVQTEEVVSMLSRDSNFVNVLRLIEDWWCCPRTVNAVPDQTSILFSLWLPASFAVPILAFSSLLLKKYTKYIIAFCTLAIGGIFFTLGYQAPINLWPIFLFDIPIISGFNWLFREPDKWAFMISFAYSFLLAMVSLEILKFIETTKYCNILTCLFLILIVGSIALYSFPIYKDSLGKAYSPVMIPSDLYTLNNYLTNANAIKKFILMPYTGNDKPLWSQGQLINNIFYQLSTVKPSISPSTFYYNFIFDSIMSNKTTNISNLIYPFGTSYLVYHNDTSKSNYIDFLRKLYSLADVRNVENIGFFKIFKVGGQEAKELSIPMQNMAVIGGLEKLLTLNYVPSFNTITSSIFFLDSNTNRDKYHFTKNVDSIILTRNSSLALPLSFINDKYMILPFDISNHHHTSKTWSKAGTMDPLHGPFHTYVEQFGVNNWDFDYGKGLVLTWAKNTILNIPVDIPNEGNYDFFVRFLKSQQGGDIKIYLENNLLKDLTTKDQSSHFDWEQVSTLNVKKGRHILTLENVDGMNAVNLFAVLPQYEKYRLAQDAYTISSRLRNIYTFEAESNFNSNNESSTKANDISSLFHLRDNITEKQEINASGGKVLVLPSRSEVSAPVDILKPSNYVVALRVKTCTLDCSFLRVSMGNNTSNIPLVSNRSQFTWQYLKTYLNAGKNELKINSKSATELDSVVLYSTDKNNETLENIFGVPNDDLRASPAKIIDYNKIDPTKYVVKVKSQKPHLLTFAQPYDPLWTAHTEDNSYSTNSIPLFSLSNGFYINKTGEYTLVIEYKAQQWFNQGGAITIIALCAVGAYLIWRKRSQIKRLNLILNKA